MRPPEAPRSLLVLKPSSFGDIIHTLPAVARLKAAWPNCQISWLSNPEWMPLLAGNPGITETIPFPRGEFRGWGGGWRWLRWLQSGATRRGFDLALDFQGLLRTAVIGRLSGAGVLAGLDDAREGAVWLYQRVVPSPQQPVHAVERYLALTKAVTAGVSSTSEEMAGEVAFPLPAGEAITLPESFSGGFILLHPFARGKDKSMRGREIDEFIRAVGKSKVVVVGRGNPESVVGHRSCVNLLNRTSIAQLIWLTRHASFVVSVDSGPAHLAAALGRPMVSIHSWSDPRRVGPYRHDAWVWKNGCLVQVRDLATMESRFFEPRRLDLRAADVAAIATLATTSP